MEKLNNICVLGAGAWGTTIANYLASIGFYIKIWAYEKKVVSDINKIKENKIYLPNVKLNKNITATNVMLDAIDKCSTILIAIPTKHLRNTLEKEKINFDNKKIVLSLTKGIEKNTYKRPSQIIREITKCKNICALSGPNLSFEIALGLPAATVIASENLNLAKKLQKLFSSQKFRIYTSRDIIGVEIGGAVKNVIAIAAGICDGLNLGNNAKSALLVRGLAEITRLGKALGAKKETFFGLSGIGDLITTCESNLSRNHFVGKEIAKGKKLNEILNNMKAVPEGVETTLSVYELSKKLNVEMPITNQTYAVLFEKKNPKEAINALMSRPIKNESS